MVLLNLYQELPFHHRAAAVSSLVYEANARMQDPVHGCVGTISYLQNQVSQLQMQLALAQAEILCIQMQQEPHLVSPQIAFDDKSFVLHDNLSSISQLMDFPPSGNIVQVQEPLKRESLWT